MNGQFLVVTDDKDIRFTPDGKVAALDAINALNDQLPAERIWEEFRRDNPDIACTEYKFPGDETLCAIDRHTMQRAEDWLFDYTVERFCKWNDRCRLRDEYPNPVMRRERSQA